ncbi:hypothetical protein CSA17_00900 [bacterium DOLJORAL78_65_58]|nr:MAG: hypothetical protein CSB20_03660 [bacterium DOLZORAL124_64_63]PIE76683.1 MAG: hypothetical protein CSA17_00900 [bacterium DOLJORAL78_65_58]
MISTIKKKAMGEGSLVRAGALVCLLLMVCVAAPSRARMDTPNPILELGYNPGGVFELEGDFVMNVGEVQINITNWGLIGSAFSVATTFSDAPSCQWPAGSGNEYLWAAGLWVGGVVLGERLVSTGGWSSEWMPLNELEATIYEAVGTKLLRPAGNTGASGRRAPMPNPDDDDDGVIDEETLNGLDDDGDGLIDEDFAQIGNQMMVLTNYDNTPLAQESFPDHTPMNLQVVQSSFQWENDQVDDFVGFDYKITNIGVTDIQRVYVGFFADSDIGPRSGEGTAENDMAGSWRGTVRASDDSWVPVEVGYMWDAAENTPLDGYFGILFLGHDVDPTGATAPTHVGLRTFQKFQGNATFDQGGDPSNDDEAYQLLSAPASEWDINTGRGKEADFRFMVSAGPFATLKQDETLNFQVGMVVGPGLGDYLGSPGLLSNCAEAALTWYGIWVDDIPNQLSTDNSTEVITGERGRETMLCREDFESGVFENFFPDFMDTSCVELTWLLGQPHVQPEDMFEYTFKDGEIKTCAMFNMDNCFECERQLGVSCSSEAIENGSWNCNDPQATNLAGCTGVGGAETQIHWLVGMAPPPPGLRIWAGDSRVHVFWDDTSEITPDIRLQEVDFESYRIWRADNWDRPYGSSEINGPESGLWQMINEFDLINNQVIYRELPDGTAVLDTIPLGANTGLEVISYTPRCLSDPTFDGLAEAMQEFVNTDPDNFISTRPHLRDGTGAVRPGMQDLVRWESYPAVLDTFWAVTERVPDAQNGVIGKHGTRYYEYIDRDIHNGFLYFYSVTATDHAMYAPGHETGITLPVGTGLAGDPGSSFSYTTPGTEAQTAEDRARNGTNIYVYPNPATRDALAEYQEMFPSGDDPTGVRVTFTNLPAAKNTIKIFTASGDLVQTITHDGTSGVGHTSWNLMSRNGQEIVSGVYLFTVQSDNGAFEDFVGKFVVVR